VELLLANKAQMDQWALNEAVLGMHDDVAALLLANGADVNVWETNGQTPLLALTDSESNAYGAPDVDFLLTNKADINAKDDQGNTPLHYAARWGHADIVKLLLACGGRVGATNLKGQTPLDLAKNHADDAFFPNQNYHDVVVLLLQHGAHE
jgi:ankyrin repeat protein